MRATTLALTVVALGTLCPSASAQPHASRTVLTIHWNSEIFPGSDAIDTGIRNVLLAQTDPTVTYFAEYLESDELPPETAENALRESIRRKFEGRGIDVVIANASAALQFALRYRSELFPGVPIVFAAVAVPQGLNQAADRITGVVRDGVFGPTMDLALNLHPAAKRAFVIAQAPSVAGYDERIRSALSPFSGRIDITYIRERTVPGLIAAIKGLPADSLIFYTRYTPNEFTRVMYPDEIVRLVAEVSPVPIYTASDVYVGSGVVGGVMRSTEATGTQVGQIAHRILQGTPPEKIPIEDVPATTILDWRQVRRWGIEASRLPPDSTILFRTPTVWETYGWYIAGTVVVVVAQLLLIAGLVAQRTRRRRAERTVRARESSLRASYERIRQLAGRLINAQEAARTGLAQDLHDDVCQQLVYISAAVESLRSSSGDIQSATAQQAFADLARTTRSTFDGIRRLSHDLHPPALRLLGLVPALKAHCNEVARQYNVDVTFSSEGNPTPLHPDVSVCLFRIAQESLRNGVVHGDARRLEVSLSRSGSDVELTVTDDGLGFDLHEVRRQGSGLGLVSMEERVHAVGGTMHIVSGIRKGTTIRVRCPVVAPRGQ